MPKMIFIKEEYSISMNQIWKKNHNKKVVNLLSTLTNEKWLSESEYQCWRPVFIFVHQLVPSPNNVDWKNNWNFLPNCLHHLFNVESFLIYENSGKTRIIPKQFTSWQEIIIICCCNMFTVWRCQISRW